MIWFDTRVGVLRGLDEKEYRAACKKYHEMYNKREIKEVMELMGTKNREKALAQMVQDDMIYLE